MSSTKLTGLTLFFTGLTLPIIAYVWGQIYNANIASYGGPPNQGAMILAYLVLVAAVIVGGALAIIGSIMTILVIRKEHRDHGLTNNDPK
jgi:hypothetical protein